MVRSWPLTAIVVNDYENQEGWLFPSISLLLWWKFNSPSFCIALVGALEIGEADNASHRYWLQFGQQRKAKWLSTFAELGVRRNVDLRRAGSIANFAVILEEEENWEELFKTEQAKAEQLEEQVQNWEERYQELEKNHKEELEGTTQRTEAEKAASQSQFDQELKTLRAQLAKSESEVNKIKPLVLQEQEKLRTIEEELKTKGEELQRIISQTEEDKKKLITQFEADLEAHFASSKKEHEAQRKLNRTLEANVHQLSEQNQAQKKQLEDKLGTIEKTLALAQTELQAALKREKAAQEELQKAMEEFQQPLEELQKATKDLSISRSREAELSEKIEKLTHHLEETTMSGEASVQSLHEELVRLDGVEASLKAELTLAQSSFDDLKGELESSRALAADESDRLAQELALSKSLIAEVVKEKEDLLARVDSAEKQATKIMEEKDKIAADLKTAREEISLLQSTQHSSITEAQHRLREAEVGQTRGESLLKATQETVVSLETKLSANEDQKRQLEAEVAQVRSLLQTALGTQEDLRREATLVHQRHLKEAETATNQILSLGAVGEDLRRQLAERGLQYEREKATEEKKKKKRSTEEQLWMVATIVLAGLLVGFLGLQAV